MTRALTLMHTDGQVFSFDAGALCLELLVTGGAHATGTFRAQDGTLAAGTLAATADSRATGGLSVDHHSRVPRRTRAASRQAQDELLRSPADFASWAALSRLDLARYRVHPATVRTTAADLRLVRTLREAVRRCADRAIAGRPPLAADLAVVNDAAAAPGVAPQIEPETGRLAWRDPVTARQLIAEIARDAVATFTEPAIRRVRRCAAATCALVYLDTSGPGRRRWCSMQRCGNRQKVRNYRRRQRAAASRTD